MTFSARRLSVLAVLCALATGCGAPPAAGPAARPAGAAGPSPSSSPHPATPPAVRTPPTLPPGPDGLTPVFERRTDGAGGADGTGGTAGRGGTGDAAGRAADRTVALTFDADMTADQGPRAAGGERFDNPALIATLRRLEVEATVFMTGRWAEEYPDQARSIGTDPRFEIANHSYSHHAFRSPCYGLPRLPPEEMAADVRKAFAAFRAAGARNVVPYFRFPGGCHDEAALRALAPTKVTAVQWDVVGGDAFASDADAVADQVLAGVRPGSVVVLHCTRSAAPVTEAAVRRIVPELRARGYRFVKVSDLIATRTAH
ncbi:polysaccharide deacetylase family protein [Streptomyces kanasensis]|uniref:polysaccharide deacetylase family protein n=1 Tax=Streptomyces kanasensis TaxID=936756 RepID=UPI00370195B7